MEFKFKTNVTVNLKGSVYLHVFCTSIVVMARCNSFVPDYYCFQLYDDTVAKVPVGLVENFSYFKSMFDTEPVYFTFRKEIENVK